jgi:hypothetical protein
VREGQMCVCVLVCVCLRPHAWQGSSSATCSVCSVSSTRDAACVRAECHVSNEKTPTPLRRNDGKPTTSVLMCAYYQTIKPFLPWKRYARAEVL